MVSAIIGLIFLMDPMSGQMGADKAVFNSKEECEAASRDFIRQAQAQGLDGRYICLDVSEMKSVHDAEI